MSPLYEFTTGKKDFTVSKDLLMNLPTETSLYTDPSRRDYFSSTCIASGIAVSEI